MKEGGITQLMKKQYKLIVELPPYPLMLVNKDPQILEMPPKNNPRNTKML